MKQLLTSGIYYIEVKERIKPKTDDTELQSEHGLTFKMYLPFRQNQSSTYLPYGSLLDQYQCSLLSSFRRKI